MTNSKQIESWLEKSEWFKSHRIDFDANVAEKLVNLGVETLTDMTDLDVGDIEDVFPKKLQRKRFLSALEDHVMQEFHKQEMRELREQHKEDLRHQDQDEDGSKASASSPDPDSEFSYPDSEFSYPDVDDKPRSSPPPPNIIPPPQPKLEPNRVGK